MPNWFYAGDGYQEAEHFFVKPAQAASNNGMVLHRYSNQTLAKTDVNLVYNGNFSSEKSGYTSKPVIFGSGDAWMIWPRSKCEFEISGGVGYDFRGVKPYVSLDKGQTWSVRPSPVKWSDDYFDTIRKETRTYTGVWVMGSQALKIGDNVTWFLSLLITSKNTSNANALREFKTFKSTDFGQTWSLLPEIPAGAPGTNVSGGPLVVNGSGRTVLHANTVGPESFGSADPKYQQPGMSYGHKYVSYDVGATWVRLSTGNDNPISTADFYANGHTPNGLTDVMFFGDERYFTVNDTDWYPKGLNPSGYRDIGDNFPPPNKHKYVFFQTFPILPDMDYVNQKYLNMTGGHIEPVNANPTDSNAVWAQNEPAYEMLYAGNNLWFRTKVINLGDAIVTQRSADGGSSWFSPVGDYNLIFTQKNTMGYCNVRRYGQGT